MNFAPIVMFVYNRPNHFRESVKALAKCPEAKSSVLYLFSDGPKNDAAEDGVKKVRELAHEVEAGNDFQKVVLTECNINKGLAQSVISGVSHVIEKHGRVIVLEDDCVVSPFFLNFMNRCLDFYEIDPKIGSITGFAPPFGFSEKDQNDIFLAYRSCSLGWATWKRNWDGVDWDLENIKQFYHQPKLIKKMNANGNDRFLRLYRQTKGDGTSWSVRFGLHLVVNDWLTVYPRYSYIQNIGCDDSGVHAKSEDADAMSVDLSKAIENPNLKAVSLNRQIQRRMKRHYSGGLISDIKRAVAIRAIILKENLFR